MNVPCPVESCDRPRPGNAPICGACEADLARALGDVPALAQELDTSLARQTSKAAGGGSEIPLPYGQRASHAQWILRNTLAGWVRVLLDDHTRPEGPRCATCGHWSCGLIAYLTEPADTIQDMAGWLLVRLRNLLRYPAIDEAVDEITTAVRDAWHDVDRPPDSTFAGKCGECGTSLYAKAGAVGVKCRECGTSHDVAAQWEVMRGQIEDQLLHSVAMSAVLLHLGVRVPAGTIRWWGSEDEESDRPQRLFPHGYDANGRPLYRVSEVLALHDERVEKKAARTARAGKVAS